jgi:hypothetical protein
MLLISTLGSVDGYAQTDGCRDLVNPIEKDRDAVQAEGGVWTIFSKIPTLGRHSARAVAVDSKINKLIVTLVYLCETNSGVPLNELASYVSRKVTELGESEFRSLHITLGKPEQEIENWLAYTKIALVKQKRTLELKKIRKSIQDAKRLVGKYRALFTEFQNQKNMEPVLSRTVSLEKEIDNVFISDPYVALAIFEESQVPFWDIDENYGGS